MVSRDCVTHFHSIAIRRTTACALNRPDGIPAPVIGSPPFIGKEMPKVVVVVRDGDLAELVGPPRLAPKVGEGGSAA